MMQALSKRRARLAFGIAVATGMAACATPRQPPGATLDGPPQQPFICRSQESGLGPPLVDNHDGIGHPVFDPASGQLLGHSQYCRIASRIGHFYFDGSGFKPFDPATGYATPPADLATTTLNGAQVPFVVRVEAGSINRFLYTIAMLAPSAVFDRSAWNRKLVYWLRGGVGIGHQQGTAMWFNNGLSGSELQLLPRILAQGYAVLSSSGNEAGVHYNMRLAEQTAMLTKAHFIEAYGRPRYTLGLGGSGGAVQQYLFAQNRPGLLDGGIALQSFPDMVTQATPISDCPLLGQYFQDAVALDPASPWASWSKQRLVEGMNASARRGTACRDPAGVPAPRRAGDLSAIAQAVASGQVFTGRRLDMPLIDLRPYLEAELNMHNARQSFSARARLLDANPAAAKNQVIWVTGSTNSALAVVMRAMAVMDRYLDDGAAPAEFTDQCIGANGATIAAGPAVWDGILNQNPAGACASAFPIFSSPRMVAGESIKGDVFKCALKPVVAALADGTYGAGAPFTAGQRAWLQKIFPDGVCDYAAAGPR